MPKDGLFPLAESDPCRSFYVAQVCLLVLDAYHVYTRDYSALTRSYERLLGDEGGYDLIRAAQVDCRVFATSREFEKICFLLEIDYERARDFILRLLLYDPVAAESLRRAKRAFGEGLAWFPVKREV